MNVPMWYTELIFRYLDGSISVEQFQESFFQKFKLEARLDEQVFEVLDELFADLDAYTSSAELLADNPRFYIDELTLRAKAQTAANRLISLRTRSMGQQGSRGEA